MQPLQLNTKEYNILIACIGGDLRVNGKFDIDKIKGKISELQEIL